MRLTCSNMLEIPPQIHPNPDTSNTDILKVVVLYVFYQQMDKVIVLHLLIKEIFQREEVF